MDSSACKGCNPFASSAAAAGMAPSGPFLAPIAESAFDSTFFGAFA